MLIIELDGLTHQWEETAVKDSKKEKELTDLGFTLLRFDDEEVLNDIENVVRTIEHTIEELEKKLNL